MFKLKHQAKIHVALRIISIVVEWFSGGQILYEIIFTLWQVKVLVNSFVRHFYENIQSAWESAHWQGIVKETVEPLSNTGGSVKFDRRLSVKRNKSFKHTLRPMSVLPSK